MSDLTQTIHGSVYLGGPISGLAYEGATDWRHVARERLWERGIVGLSPMRFKDYLANEESIRDSYIAYQLSSAAGITSRDRFDVERCDVMIANMEGASRVSIGTVMEIAWADLFRKPIILVEQSGGLHDHAMLRASCPFIVSTLNEAIELAIAVVAPS